MKTLNHRTVALVTGGALATSMFFTSVPARADNSKNLKIGALVLGAIGVISAVKGKEVPAVLAGAGAYYAYKKSKDAKNDKYSSNDDYFPGGVYTGNSNDGNYNTYPADDGYNDGYNGGYNGGYTNYPTNNSGTNTYPTSGGPYNTGTHSNGANCPVDNNTPYYGNTDDGPYNERHRNDRDRNSRNSDRRADYGAQRPYRSLK